jgi:hypothetical protein
MTGLLNALGKTAGEEVSLDAQSPSDDERIFVGGRLEGAQVPERVRTVLRESLPVEGHVIGLDLFWVHGLPPCGNYERPSDARQVFENKGDTGFQIIPAVDGNTLDRI